MAILLVWMIACWFIFKKHKKFAIFVTKTLCYLMVFFRIARMLLLIITGKQSVVEALPWHLCHIMAIVFPLFFFTKTKKFFLPIICVTFFGGILTFIFGDYYTFAVLSFLQIESLFLHLCMPTVVIGVVATGWAEVKAEDLWQVPIFLLALAGYASIGNALIKDANFLFLVENGLPFNLFGTAHFYWTYLVLIAILSLIFLGLMCLGGYSRRLKNKKFRVSVIQKVVF